MDVFLNYKIIYLIRFYSLQHKLYKNQKGFDVCFAVCLFIYVLLVFKL